MTTEIKHGNVMNAIVSCPKCRRALHVPEDFFGQSVQCSDCKHVFEAKPPEGAIQVSSPAPRSEPAPLPEPDQSTERPHRRSDRDYDEADRDDETDLDIQRLRGPLAPDRGGIILALGIVSLVLSFFSFVLYIVPIWIIPLACGIVGWILGHRDLRAMKQGKMDSSNQVMSLVGMILSIVGVAVSVCVGLFSCAMLGFIGIMIGVAINAPPPPGKAKRF
jgi:hypothetical protein